MFQVYIQKRASYITGMGFVHVEDNASVDNIPSAYEEFHASYISYTKYVMLVIIIPNQNRYHFAAVFCNTFTINGEQVCSVNDNKK